MKKIFFNKIFHWFLFLLILFFFLYFRLKPIFLQNIPYTYDQGRDFLKAQEIVLYKNLTFIGPTTGIMGIYHGAWWYYLLSVAFFIFDGRPTGFAYAICFFYSLSFLLFYFFIKKELGFYPAMFFLSLAAFSPYLSFISTFVINSGFTIPFILLLLYSLHQYFRTKTPFFLFFIFLSAGFIFEAQVSFGLFLIPSLILTFFSLYLKKIDIKGIKFKPFFYSLSGLFIPFLPRLLFEIKNHFLQTKTFFNFFFHPKYYNPKPFTSIIEERLNLFIDYYFKIFNQNILAIAFFILTLIILFLFFKKLKNYQRDFLKANFFLIIFIFILSLFYKDNFWNNYLEGFSVFYLPFLTFSFYLGLKGKDKLISVLIYILLIIFLFINMFNFYNNLTNKKIVEEGLIKQKKVVERIYQLVGKNDFCLKIYTPPVIPYTYQYLIDYQARIKKYSKPKLEYVNNRCFYIIEDDAYKFRIDRWREENIPKEAKLIKKEKIFKDIAIELWERI